jgi:uncharacterized protein (TIGR03067 family)
MVLAVPGLVAATPMNAVKTEKEKLQGSWIVVSAEEDGEKVPEKDLKRMKLTWTFKGDKLVSSEVGQEPDEFTYAVDPSKTPKEMDLGRNGASLSPKTKPRGIDAKTSLR